jgi:hypothetical protein
MGLDNILKHVGKVTVVIADAVKMADAYFESHGWTKDDRGIWVSPAGQPVSEWLTGPEGKALAIMWLKGAALAAGVDVDQIGMSLTGLIEMLRRKSSR